MYENVGAVRLEVAEGRFIEFLFGDNSPGTGGMLPGCSKTGREMRDACENPVQASLVGKKLENVEFVSGLPQVPPNVRSPGYRYI